MSIMKDYMDMTMEGVDDINLNPNDEIDQTYYIALKNVDNGCGTKWEFPNKLIAMAMFSSFDTLLGKIPVHEFIENHNIVVVYLNEKQIHLMIEKVESLGIDIGTETFLREIKFLLDCIDPEV